MSALGWVIVVVMFLAWLVTAAGWIVMIYCVIATRLGFAPDVCRTAVFVQEKRVARVDTGFERLYLAGWRAKECEDGAQLVTRFDATDVRAGVPIGVIIDDGPGFVLVRVGVSAWWVVPMGGMILFSALFLLLGLLLGGGVKSLLGVPFVLLFSLILGYEVRGVKGNLTSIALSLGGPPVKLSPRNPLENELGVARRTPQE